MDASASCQPHIIVKYRQDAKGRVVHHQLTNMSDDLAGLCRYRVGDYRIVYWIQHQQETLKAYRVQHRSEVYRRL